MKYKLLALLIAHNVWIIYNMYFKHQHQQFSIEAAVRASIVLITSAEFMFAFAPLLLMRGLLGFKSYYNIIVVE